MIIQVFVVIFAVSGIMALWSLRNLTPPKLKSKILRREKKGLFGVIELKRKKYL